MKTHQDLLKKQVEKYWDNEPCGTGGIKTEEGSIQYFEEVENWRYSVEPFIHSFVQFTRWHSKKVLEVGCGCGTDLLQFARAGAEVYGVDLSTKSVNLAKHRFDLYGLRAEIMKADAENLPFPDNQFDLVYSWGVIHYAPQLPQAIKEIFRVLKPGGFFRVMIYHRYSWECLKLYLRHGLLKGKPFTPLSQIVAKYEKTPGTKAYTIGEAKELFSMFSDLKFQPTLAYCDVAKWRGVFPSTWLVRLLGDNRGFYMRISGCKI